MSDSEQCTICLEFLESVQSSRQLPCRHSFCETCLQEYINKLGEGRGSINKFNCPNCRTQTASPSPGRPTSEWARHFPEFHTTTMPRYCTDCQECICAECNLLQKRRKNVSGSRKQNCPCPWNKQLAFHCLNHQLYCCSKCKAEVHARCRDVRNVAGMSDSVRFFGEIENAFARMNLIRENYQKIRDVSKNNKLSLAVEKKNIIDSIQKIHADLQFQLSQIEKTMVEEVNTVYENISSGLTERVERCETAISEIDSSGTKLKSAQSQENNDQLYISHNRFLEEMAELEKALLKTTAGTMTSEICFGSNKLTKSLRAELKSFGEIRTKVKMNVFTKKVPELKLKYRKATKCGLVKLPNPCDLNSVVVLPNGCFVMVDDNTSVHMFDSNEQPIASLDMPDAWDVCITGENEVAVTTMGQRKIHFLSTYNGLKYKRTVSTDRGCYGIAYCWATRELVITTYNANSVQILTLTGDVVKTIEKDKNGQQIFSGSANYVILNDTGNMLYVSDWDKGVIGVDRDGNVKFIYKDMTGPRSTSIDRDGNIYVSGYVSNEVHQLSPEGSRIQVLLSSTGGLNNPRGLYFNRRNDTIVVSCQNSQDLLMYSMQ